MKQGYKKILNYFVGPILFVVLSFSIYKKIRAQPHLEKSWQTIQDTFLQNRFLLLGMLALMILNWSLEAKKWQLLIAPVQKVSLITSFKAVLSGLSFSLFIPNGLGEYLGRMLYMNEGNRLKSIAVSFVGSMAQLIITITLGVTGLIFMYFEVPDIRLSSTGLSGFWIEAIIYTMVFISGLLLLLYFKISLFVKWFEKIPFIYKHRILINSLEQYDTKILLKILIYSFLRYSVFIAQYILMFYLFAVNIPIKEAIFCVSVLFLLISIVPTIPIAELGVRGELSLKVFGLLSPNVIGIFSAIGFIWLINLIIPALVGSLFVLSLKIFKKTDSKNKESENRI